LAEHGDYELLPTYEEVLDSYSTKAFASFTDFVYPENLLSLKPLASRPARCAHLGMTPITCTVNLGYPHLNERDILLDGGSALTIISRECYESLEHKPNLSKGKKIICKAVVGSTTMQQFVKIPIYFWTTEGPTKIIVEAYLNEEGSIDFILGNDWMHQYQLNTLRSPMGITVTFGDSGRACQARDTTLPPKYEPFAATSLAAEEAQNPIELAELGEYADGNDFLCRLSKPVTIPPQAMVLVDVKFNIPNGNKDGYLKTPPSLMEGTQLRSLEALVWETKQVAIITNNDPEEYDLPEGFIIGKIVDPTTYLELPPPEQREQISSAIEIMNTVLQKAYPYKEPDPDPPDPNIVALADDDPIPKEKLLESIHINPSLSEKEKKELEELLHEHQEAFGLDGRFGTPDIEYSIELKEGAIPKKIPMYHATPMRQEIVGKQLLEWIKKNVIRPITGPREWNAPLLLVMRDGKPRVCINTQYLNSQTKKRNYPMPRITDIHRALRKAKYITTLDALAGYNQFWVNEFSRGFLAFDSHLGKFEFNKLPFGLEGAPAFFQNVMNDLFADLLWKGFIVYLDDMIIYSETWEEHLAILKAVLKKIIKARITLSPKKCFFAHHKAKVLGQMVTRLGMSTVPERIKAILDLEFPKTLKELRQWLGLIIYWRNYIPRCSELLKQFTDHLKNGAPRLKKTPVLEYLFQLSREALLTAPLLIYGDPDKPFVGYSDASDLGISFILQQWYWLQLKDLKHTKIYEKCEQAFKKGKPIPALYWRAPTDRMDWNKDNFNETWVECEGMVCAVGRTYQQAEQRYSAVEKEMLAIVHGLKKCQPVIENSPRIDIVTDSHALAFVKNFGDINPRLFRWKYFFELWIPKVFVYHRNGIYNNAPDTMSRFGISGNPYYSTPTQEPEVAIEKGGIKGEKEWLETNFQEKKNLIASAIKIEWNHNFISKFIEGYKEDSRIRDIIQEIMTTKDPNNPKYPRFRINDKGLLIFQDSEERERIYVPNKRVTEILRIVHDELCNGAHFGVQKTIRNLYQQWYWKDMEKDAKEYVQSCPKCQAANPKTHKPYGKLQSPHIPKLPYDRISMDFIGPLPSSEGASAILVVIDSLTKHATIIPVKHTINELETAKILTEQVFLKQGMPLEVLSDRDARWRESFWEQVLSALGAKRMLSTSYHPQTDGATEALNKTIVIALRKFVDENLSNWPSKLPYLEAAYNSSTHTMTGATPHYLLKGYEMRLPKNFDTKAPENRHAFDKKSAKDFVEAIQNRRQQAKDTILIAQQAYAEQYNRKHKMIDIQIGDKVWIKAKELGLRGDYTAPGNKLRNPYEGPYLIDQKASDLVYHVQLPPNLDIYPWINIEKLELHRESPIRFGKREPATEPRRRHVRLKDTEVKYITAETFKISGDRQKKYYQAVWVDESGQEYEDGVWVPARNFNNCKKVKDDWEWKKKLLNIQPVEYKKRQKSTSKPASKPFNPTPHRRSARLLKL
jgi:hypothetical protein